MWCNWTWNGTYSSEGAWPGGGWGFTDLGPGACAVPGVRVWAQPTWLCVTTIMHYNYDVHGYLEGGS